MVLLNILFVATGYAASSTDNVPSGRAPVEIGDGQYPASYFPNTELLGPAEMRITALGTGMPNQTKAAVSTAYAGKLSRENSAFRVASLPGEDLTGTGQYCF